MLSLLAAIALAQCATGITDNTQNFCGQKLFSGGIYSCYATGCSYLDESGLTLNAQYASITMQGGRALQLRDTTPAGSPSPSFVLQTLAQRNSTDEILRVYNRNDVVFLVYGDGKVISGPIKTRGHAGDPSLIAGTGLYVGIAGDLPPNYQGEHGALSVSNTNPCVGHNLIQASNGRTGARSDYAFNVSCRGGIYSRDLINSTDLPLCNGGLPEPPEPNNRFEPCPNLVVPHQCNSGQCGAQIDGGYCHDWTTFYATSDAGYAKAGETFGFVSDVGEGCQCVPAKYDGGASPAGWFKLSDRSECR